MSSDVNDPSDKSGRTNNNVTCYFCGEYFQERYITEHVTQCAAVLEECKKKCGAYLPRSNLMMHQANCGVKKNRQEERKSVISSSDAGWKEKVMSVLNLLRTSIADGKREQRELEERVNRGLEILKSKEAVLDKLRIELLAAKKESKKSTEEIDFRIGRLEQIFTTVDERFSFNFKRIYDQLEAFENRLGDAEILRNSKIGEWRKEIEGFRRFLSDENVMISAVWHEQLKRINDIKLELEMRCKDSKELFDSRDIFTEKMEIIVGEISSHSEAIKNQIADTKALKFQLKENANYLEDLIKELSTQNINENSRFLKEDEFPEPISTNGRLLWRIDRYKEKMTSAKENDVVITSPVFYSKEYGYKLSLELFLNGRGQWKDRHIIGCLKILEGKWDPLLDWPCILQASVVLRDQDNPANNVKKTLKARRKESDKNHDDKLVVTKESGMYMFIPHSKLTRHEGFTKNNIIFIDVQIKDVKFTGSVGSLIP